MKQYYLLLGALLITSLTASATTYSIGPSETYSAIGDAPLDSLVAGDTVLIHARPTPYKEKWVITAQGTQHAPVVFRGIPDALGTLPVIDGENAVTPVRMNFWSEVRGVIKIGGSNNPPDIMPAYIIIENLEIKNGRQPYHFTGRDGDEAYGKNAAALYLEKGEHITIRNCIIHNCGNGLFSASQTSDVLVEYCSIYDNGVENSIYEHNSYTESMGITFQYNHYGALRTNCLGNNLKDRSAGCVVRYNWIESGNRQLDLVDTDYASFYTDPSYNTTFVYGNILIEPEDAGNSQICHYGGDSGDEVRYRKGTLYFYNNTVISTRSGNTTLFRLSSNSETVDCRNNILYTPATGSRFAIVDENGTANLRHNWLPTGWSASHSSRSADVNDVAGQITGTKPGFINESAQNYALVSNAPTRDAGTVQASATTAYAVSQEYVVHVSAIPRNDTGLPDLGAFAVASSSIQEREANAPAQLIHIQLSDNNIHYTLTTSAHIAISIYHCSGELINTHIIGRQKRGQHTYSLPALSTGRYFFTLSIDNVVRIHKLISL